VRPAPHPSPNNGIARVNVDDWWIEKQPGSDIDGHIRCLDNRRVRESVDPQSGGRKEEHTNETRKANDVARSCPKISVHNDDVFLNESAKIVWDPPGNCKQKFRDSRKLLTASGNSVAIAASQARSSIAKKIVAHAVRLANHGNR